MRKKVKAALIAAIVVVAFSAGVATYGYLKDRNAHRTVTVTLERVGLPSRINWSISLLLPYSFNNLNLNGNTSSITIKGLQKNNWYSFIPRYAGLYLATLPPPFGGGLYHPPQVPSGSPSNSWPLQFKTGSNSTVLKVLFYPFLLINVNQTVTILNHSRYYSIPDDGIYNWPADIQGPLLPNEQNFTFYLQTGPRNSTNVTHLSRGPGGNVTLYGSYKVVSINLTSNVSGISVTFNRTFPWQIEPVPQGLSLLEAYVHIPDVPTIAMFQFTITIADWNPNATYNP